MKLRHLFLSGALTFSLIASGTFAAELDIAKKQAEIRKVTQAALVV